MEGLEVVEIKFSDLKLSDRADAEYVTKENLRIENLLRNLPNERLGKFCALTASAFYPAATHLYDELGVPFIRCLDCIDFPIISSLQDESFERLPEDFIAAHQSIRSVKKGELVITKVGSPCYTSIVHEHSELALSRTVLGVISIRDVDPYYLMVFLRSYYGFSQLMRQREQTIQFQLTLERVRDIDVFLPSKKFQTQIARLSKISFEELKNGKLKIQRAEQTLIRSLGLDNWQPPEALTYIRNSRDAFAAERFDAEYFHPAKRQAIADLSALSDCTVGDLFSSIRDLWQPGDGKPTNLVRNYDLTDALSPFLDASKEPVERATIASTKKRIAPGDLVVSRLRSYLREIALVQPADHIPMVASTEFIVLRPRSSCTLPVEALLVYLRSSLPQVIFKWSQDGSNHPRFDEKELLRLPVPRALIDEADEYVRLIKAMIEGRENAAKLLAAAKHAVEIAIENSEAAALAYLESQKYLARDPADA